MNIEPIHTSTLYRIETFTDSSTADLTVFVPVTVRGEIDISRPMKFRGKTQVVGLGPRPIVAEFDIPVDSLEAAVAAWPEVVNRAIEEVRSQMVRRTILDPGTRPASPQS